MSPAVRRRRYASLRSSLNRKTVPGMQERLLWCFVDEQTRDVQQHRRERETVDDHVSPAQDVVGEYDVDDLPEAEEYLNRRGGLLPEVTD